MHQSGDDVDRDQITAPPPGGRHRSGPAVGRHTEESGQADRRALLGTLTGVLGAGAVGVALANSDGVRTATLSGSGRASSSGDDLTVQGRDGSGATRRHRDRRRGSRRDRSSVDAPSPARPRADRPVSRQPSEGGGPRTRDESFAEASSTTAKPSKPGSGAAGGPGVSNLPPLPPGRQYSGFAAAAAAAKPVAPAVFDPADSEMHLLRRATFGARPSDVQALRRQGIDGWLSTQLSPASIDDGEADRAWRQFPLAGATPQRVRASVEKHHWDAMTQTAQATLGRQIFSDRQLYEQVVDVMANHLHVPLPAGEVWDSGPDYHNQVIRRHAFGRFEDMLLDAMKHPAMLTYLNNNVSHQDDVNENLGRELLELHTVGVGSGYTEKDVRNSAYILTGRRTQDEPTRFAYDASMHRTGRVTVLDFRHANGSAGGGMDVGDAYLSYLARHPATAAMIARKFAVRFVADQPSDDLVERIAAVYLDNGTDLRETVRAVFQSSDFWSSVGMKARRPLEDVVGASRVLDVRPGGAVRKRLEDLYWQLRDAGHAPYDWPPPNGFPDVAAAWTNAGGMVARWNLHRKLARGWFDDGLQMDSAEKLAPAGGSIGDWIDTMSRRLVGQPLSAEHRSALLSYSGVDASVATADHLREAPHLASLVLDSPYFQLR